MDALERRKQQNLRASRRDPRGVTPSIRSFAQAIDRGEPETIPVLAAARPDLVDVAKALDDAEVAALAIDVDDPAAELERFAAAARAVSVPVVRTDLLLEEFQIYESRAAGADAVVLRADVLGGAFERLFDAARSTHMAACVSGAQARGAIALRDDSLLLDGRVVARLDRTLGAAPDPAGAFRALLKGT